MQEIFNEIISRWVSDSHHRSFSQFDESVLVLTEEEKKVLVEYLESGTKLNPMKKEV